MQIGYNICSEYDDQIYFLTKAQVMESNKQGKSALQDETTNKKVAEYLGITYDEYKQSGGRIERDSAVPSLYTVYFNDDMPINILNKVKGIDTVRNFVVLPDSFFIQK